MGAVLKAPPALKLHPIDSGIALGALAPPGRFCVPSACSRWIESIADGAAQGDLRRLYDAGRDAIGQVPGLPRAEREWIAVLVSHHNRCTYCLHHHRRGLRRLLQPEASNPDGLIDAMLADPQQAPIPTRRKAMLAYVEKLTRSPGQMAAADVAALRIAGFADADVLAIAEVTAYFAYVNRVADGLGLAIEPWNLDSAG